MGTADANRSTEIAHDFPALIVNPFLQELCAVKESRHNSVSQCLFPLHSRDLQLIAYLCM
jgi:hypothetical protein